LCDNALFELSEVLPLIPTNLKKAQIEPAWAEWDRIRNSAIPTDVVEWLRDRGSLTARLKRACGGGFRVRVMHQGWGRPLYSERALLKMRNGEAAIVREVELLCGEIPWVFARTLIPATSLRGPARRLSMLGSKPLGEVLFADPRTQRERMEIARLQPRHPLFQAATCSLEQKPEDIWGRRTLFELAGKPLLVNEIFLPDIPKSSL
jgi:chorismate--pyruvate lyase